MKNFTAITKAYILATIFIGVILMARYLPGMRWDRLGIYLLAGLAGVGQVLKLEGPTARSNYNIGWLIYGFTFVALGLPAGLFVVLVAHLIEWLWHKYPWYIQTFNIGVYAIAMSAASWTYNLITPFETPLDLAGALGILAALVVFTLINHLMVGMVIKLARGQSLSESGVFEPVSLMLDLTMLGMGAGTAIVWYVNPFAVILNVIPLYLIHNAIRVPALKRQVEMLEASLNERQLAQQQFSGD